MHGQTIRSATDIVRMGVSVIQAAIPNLSNPEAAEILRRTTEAHTRAATLAMIAFDRQAPAIRDVYQPVVPTSAEVADTLVNYRREARYTAGADTGGYVGSLGPLGYIACDDCRSMLSPSAYLVDLLAVMKRESIGGGLTLFNLLEGRDDGGTALFASATSSPSFFRRTDIASLELTCENTSDPIRYTDRTVEVLLAGTGSSADPESAGTWTAIADSQHPWSSLPFERDRVRLGIELESLTLSEADVIADIHSEDVSDATARTALETRLAKSVLGLSDKKWDFLTEGVNAGTEPGRWGNASNVTLHHLIEFMDRSELGVDDVRRIVEHPLFNLDWTVTGTSEADLDQIQISAAALSDANQRNMRQVIQTSGWMGYSIAEALESVRALDPGPATNFARYDDADLRALGLLKHFLGDLRPSRAELLGLLRPLPEVTLTESESEEVTNLYTLFVHDPLAGRFDDGGLRVIPPSPNTSDNPTVTGPIPLAQRDGLASAMGMSRAEFDACQR